MALTRFTVLFGMGRGGSERLLPPSKGVGLLGLVNRPQLEKERRKCFAFVPYWICCDCSVLHVFDLELIYKPVFKVIGSSRTGN